jgi:hypothetical protein
LDGQAVSKLREALAAELAKKVSQHGLVVWQDDAGEYAHLAADVTPPNVLFARYEASWYALRHMIEPHLEGDEPPRLVVYVPAPPPEDPLLEVRKSGQHFVRRLPTLVREALKGELAEHRINQLCAQARTLTDVEIALSSGEGADVRLIRMLDSAEPRTMALRLLTGERDKQVAAEDGWALAATFLSDNLGGSLSGAGEDLRAAAARQLLLTEIESAVGPLPHALGPAWSPATADQRRRTLELLSQWRADPARRESYARLASGVDSALALADHLEWEDGLAGCVASPGVEEVVYRHVLALLADGSWELASSLARAREQSPWSRPDLASAGWEQRGSRWRAVVAIAELRRTISTAPVPKARRYAELLGWYSEVGWRVDQAHRAYELARVALDLQGELEQHIVAARAAYEAWIDGMLLATSATLEGDGVDVGPLARQGEVHDRWVSGVDGPVAYVWVDALRYELGQELAEQLAGISGRVEVYSALAAAPAITPVGMANLAPDAASRLSLMLDGEKLVVRLSGTPISGVTERINQLRAAHPGGVADLTLDEAASLLDKELKKAVESAQLLLVRSQELDAQGESGMLNTAWPQFAQVVQLLVRLVARLGHAGVRRVVITADHGFVALPRGLGADRTVDPPTGGVGELHRRVWVGCGGTTTPSTLRVPLAATGTTGNVDLIVPRGLAVFRGSGSKQFFHGGLSPQELLVPVVVVDLATPTAAPKLKVAVAVAGERITTGTFAATLVFEGDLFTSEIMVRAVAQGRDGATIVARVVSGDGFDPASGVITLRADASPVVAFQVTADLNRGDVVRIEILDAATGVVLGATDVPVAARIVVENELE